MTDILFVDDDAFILSTLRRLMRRENFSFKTAEGGEQALTILESEHIPVIISDYMMPGMNGVELHSVLRKRWPNTIRAILSGYADKEVMAAALATGVVHKYLLKPWNDEQLKQTIRDMVERSRVFRDNNFIGEGI